MQDLDAYRNAIRANTKMVFVETPANPNLKVIDLRTVSDIAHKINSDITVMCDSSFSSPYIQNPLQHGCGAVVHSLTKYINGHGNFDRLIYLIIFLLKHISGA